MGSQVNLRVLDLHSLFGGQPTSHVVLPDVQLCSLEAYGNTSAFRQDHQYDSIDGIPSLSVTRPSISIGCSTASSRQATLLVTFRGQYLPSSNDLDDFLTCNAIFEPASSSQKPSLVEVDRPKRGRLVKDGAAFDGVASGVVSSNSRSLFFLKSHPGRKEYSEPGVMCLSQSGSTTFARLPEEIADAVRGVNKGNRGWVPVLDPSSNALLCRRLSKGSGEHFVDIYYPC